MAEGFISEQNLNIVTDSPKTLNPFEQKQPIFLLNDEAYLEEYFKICRAYKLKRIILNKSLSFKNRKELSIGKRFKKRISIINQWIKKEEDKFWKGVENSKKQGIRFSIEEIASQYNLDLFEKRALLFFLYLVYFPIENNSFDRNYLGEEELLWILDTEDSVLSRMRNFNYLTLEAKLFSNEFLTRQYSIGKGEIQISSFALKMISDALTSKELLIKQSLDYSSAKTVGYIKEPEYSLEDVVLKQEIKERILFLLDNSKKELWERFGINQKIKKSKGLTFLFYGPPGTGKSMLAEAIANYLKKKILIVEFPKIISGWLGETEKALARIFTEAKKNTLVICIDEADSLLYSRNFATQEHDIRFVNIMLSEVERFEGEMIFTTNMESLLDSALERRLTLKIKFELPDENMRAKIWKAHIPDKFTISKDVDFLAIARQFNFSGGYIKNAVLHALRKLIQENRTIITMEDLIFGARLEQEGIFTQQNKQKIGFSVHI